MPAHVHFPIQRIVRFVELICTRLCYHTLSCHQPLQHDWPNEYKDVISALQDKSSAKVITGQTTAPAVRLPGKRKATDEHAGRVPITFTSSSSPKGPELPETGLQSLLPSASSTLQTKLSQSWGDHKLTAVRQAKIDLMLLRFIVCCAIAFSIIDNGFLIDFINTLWVYSVSLVPREY